MSGSREATAGSEGYAPLGDVPVDAPAGSAPLTPTTTDTGAPPPVSPAPPASAANPNPFEESLLDPNDKLEVVVSPANQAKEKLLESNDLKSDAAIEHGSSNGNSNGNGTATKYIPRSDSPSPADVLRDSEVADKKLQVILRKESKKNPGQWLAHGIVQTFDGAGPSDVFGIPLANALHIPRQLRAFLTSPFFVLNNDMAAGLEHLSTSDFPISSITEYLENNGNNSAKRGCRSLAHKKVCELLAAEAASVIYACSLSAMNKNKYSANEHLMTAAYGMAGGVLAFGVSQLWDKCKQPILSQVQEDPTFTKTQWTARYGFTVLVEATYAFIWAEFARNLGASLLGEHSLATLSSSHFVNYVAPACLLGAYANGARSGLKICAVPEGFSKLAEGTLITVVDARAKLRINKEGQTKREYDEAYFVNNAPEDLMRERPTNKQIYKAAGWNAGSFAAGMTLAGVVNNYALPAVGDNMTPVAHFARSMLLIMVAKSPQMIRDLGKYFGPKVHSAYKDYVKKKGKVAIQKKQAKALDNDPEAGLSGPKADKSTPLSMK